MANPVMHFEVMAKDPQKLVGFYGALFGWGKEEYPDMQYTMVKTKTKADGIDGGVGKAGDVPAGVSIVVQVDSVEDALAKAKKLGATILQQPYDVPGVGRFATLGDLEGNRVGLWTVPA